MTATPRFELDPAPDPGRDLPPGPVTIALVVVGGFLIGGPFGLVVAVLALVVWRRHPDWLGALLVGLLVLAALGSVLGAWPGSDSLRQNYADDRSWAAAAGLGAGVALLVAVARAARADRAPAATVTVAPDAAPLPARLAPGLPLAGVVLLAAVVSLVLAPDAATDGLRTGAEALRAGQGLRSGAEAPLALVLVAAFPAAGAWLLAGLAAATAGATAALDTRLAGRRAGLLAGVVAALLPLVWDQRLPGALAGLLVLAAVLLAWPDRVTVARAGVAGALLVGAALARPEAALVVPVLAAWLVLWPGAGPRRARESGLVALLVVALGGLLLATLAVHGATGDWLVGTAAAPLWAADDLGPVAHLLDLVALGLALDEARRRREAGTLSVTRHLPWLVLPALAVLVGAASLGDHGLGFVLGPLVAVGAAARLTGDAPTPAPDEAADRIEAAS